MQNHRAEAPGGEIENVYPPAGSRLPPRMKNPPSYGRSYKVLLIGEDVKDVWVPCEIAGIAHEDPVLRLRPVSIQEEPGGLSFCQKLFESLLPGTKTFSIPYSETTITRYLSEKPPRVLFTVEENLPLLAGENIRHCQQLLVRNAIEQWSPDLVFLWEKWEGRGFDWEVSLENERGREHPLVATDVPRVRRLYPPDYRKDYLHGDGTGKAAQILTLRTSAKESVLYRGEEPPVIQQNPVCEVGSPIGAGDTMFVSLLCFLMEKNLLGKIPTERQCTRALQWAQAAAYLQLQHSRCYIPSYKDIKKTHELLRRTIWMKRP